MPAIAADQLEPVISLADRHDDVFFALGIHPLLVDRAADGDLARVREAVDSARAHPRFVGDAGADQSAKLGNIGRDERGVRRDGAQRIDRADIVQRVPARRDHHRIEHDRPLCEA